MTTFTYSMARALPEHLSSVVVPESFGDENGHMNVRHHFDLTATAIRGLMESVGVDHAYVTSRHRGFFTVEQHIRFTGEVHIGHVVRATVAVVARGPKVVHGMCCLLDESSESIATTVEFVVVHVDLDSRSAVPFPEEISARIDAARAAGASMALPVCGVMGPTRHGTEQERGCA